MDSEETVPEDLPDPGWKERIGAVRRAAAALATTRAEIFREELSQKGSLLAKAAVGLALAAVLGVLSFLLLTALLAAVLSRVLGGPIAGISATLFLYLVVAALAAILGGRNLSRVRPFVFPATRDEIRKDFEAVKEKAAMADDAPASAEAPAAERASVRPGDEEDDDEHERGTSAMNEMEERFRAGSE
jgi:uncharacterized membrane protein YqjE